MVKKGASSSTRRKKATTSLTSSKSKKGKKQDVVASPTTTPATPPMGSMGPVAPKNPDLLCPHLSYVRLEKMKRKILTPTAWSCSECGTTEGVWACLTCGKIGCGRYQSEHALSHYEDYQHPLALEINLSYCYCYQCEEYVTHDNKKEDLEAIRKLLLKAQTVDTETTSTTRSGKAIRPPVKIPTDSEFKDEDRLHTAVKHWRLLSLGKAFAAWKEYIATKKREKQLSLVSSGSSISSEATESPSPSPAPATTAPSTPVRDVSATTEFVTPPLPAPKGKASFLTMSTQRALASPSASRRIIPGITGLRNLGNTCFMNTVLQALSNTGEFRDFFVHMLGSTPPKEEEPEEKVEPKGKAKAKKVKTEAEDGKEKSNEGVVALVLNGKRYTRQPTLQLLDSIRKHVPKLEEVSVAMELHSLLRVLWSGKWAVVTPCSLLESVWKFVPKFRNRQQQDAQEFLCYLFDRLQLELQHANSSIGSELAPPTSPKASPKATPTSRPSRQSKTSTTNSDATKDNEENEKDKKATTSRKRRGRSPSPPPATLPPIPLSGDQATIISETFQGKLSSVVTCTSCKHSSTKLDPFLDLSVDIPVVSIAKPHRKKRKTTPKTAAKSKTKKTNGKHKPQDDNNNNNDTPNNTTETKPTSDDSNDNDTSNNTNGNNDSSTAEPIATTPTSSTSDSDNDQGPISCHLSDCLSSFIKEERVEGYACSGCNEKHDATKQLYLHTLPHVLCVVLKRFCWTATSRAKIDTQVTIPFTLDVSDYMQNGVKEKREGEETGEKKKVKGMYELRSVVMHHGVGLLSGHYTSFCYNELQDTWVHYNDARVTLVPKEQVERETPAQAYLMFYQRIFPPVESDYLIPPLPSIPHPSNSTFPTPPSSTPTPSPPSSPYHPPSSSSSNNAANPRAKRLRKL